MGSCDRDGDKLVRLKKPKRTRSPGDERTEKWGNCVKCGSGSALDSTDEYSRLYPQSQLSWWKGKLYCSVHMSTKQHEIADEHLLDIDEGDRGESI